MAGVILRVAEDAGLFAIPRLLLGDSAFPSLDVMLELHRQRIASVFALKKQRAWTKFIPAQVVYDKLIQLNVGDGVSIENKRPLNSEGKFIPAQVVYDKLIQLNIGESISVESKRPLNSEGKFFFVAGLMDMNPCLLLPMPQA